MHGLTTGDTNASESFNYVLSRLQYWDERPVDVIAVFFKCVPPSEIVHEMMSEYSKLKAEVFTYINLIISENSHLFFIITDPIKYSN